MLLEPPIDTLPRYRGSVAKRAWYPPSRPNVFRRGVTLDGGLIREGCAHWPVASVQNCSPSFATIKRSPLSTYWPTRSARHERPAHHVWAGRIRRDPV